MLWFEYFNTFPTLEKPTVAIKSATTKQSTQRNGKVSVWEYITITPPDTLAQLMNDTHGGKSDVLQCIIHCFQPLMTQQVGKDIF